MNIVDKSFNRTLNGIMNLVSRVDGVEREDKDFLPIDYEGLDSRSLARYKSLGKALLPFSIIAESIGVVYAAGALETGSLSSTIALSGAAAITFASATGGTVGSGLLIHRSNNELHDREVSVGESVV